LEFTTVPISTWLQKLREAAPTDDVKLNPALKLVEYFERMYAEDGDMTQKGELSFDTNKAQQHSRLGEAPRIIEDGFVEKFLSQWMKKWEEKAQETPKRFVEDEDHSQGAESVEYTSAPEIPDEPTEKRKRQAEVHAPVDGLPLAKRSMMAAVNGKGH